MAGKDRKLLILFCQPTLLKSHECTINTDLDNSYIERHRMDGGNVVYLEIRRGNW